MNNKLLQLTVFTLMTGISISAYSVQDVYEYEDKSGTIEFTDRVKTNIKPERHIQIEKRTPQQEAKSQAILNDIIKKDQEFDRYMAEQRRLESEYRQRQREINTQRSIQYDEYEDYDNNRYGYYGRSYRYRPWRPIVHPRPVHPIEKPKPVHKPKPISSQVKPNPSFPFSPNR